MIIMRKQDCSPDNIGREELLEFTQQTDNSLGLLLVLLLPVFIVNDQVKQQL